VFETDPPNMPVTQAKEAAIANAIASRCQLHIILITLCTTLESTVCRLFRQRTSALRINTYAAIDCIRDEFRR
jgi:hypothetical protein